ncbi:hypothetical protein AAG906_016410 [Vitis piasezkii]
MSSRLIADVWAYVILVLRELGMPKGVGCGGAYGFDGVHPKEPKLVVFVKVSAEMGIGDKVYAYLHKPRTDVRSVEVALKNGGGWHGQGWIGKGSGWFVEPKLIRVANVVLAGGYSC